MVISRAKQSVHIIPLPNLECAATFPPNAQVTSDIVVISLETISDIEVMIFQNEIPMETTDGFMWYYNTYFGYKFTDIKNDLDNLKSKGIRVLGFFGPFMAPLKIKILRLKLCLNKLIFTCSNDSF